MKIANVIFGIVKAHFIGIYAIVIISSIFQRLGSPLSSMSINISSFILIIILSILYIKSGNTSFLNLLVHAIIGFCITLLIVQSFYELSILQIIALFVLLMVVKFSLDSSKRKVNFNSEIERINRKKIYKLPNGFSNEVPVNSWNLSPSKTAEIKACIDKINQTIKDRKRVYDLNKNRIYELILFNNYIEVNIDNMNSIRVNNEDAFYDWAVTLYYKDGKYSKKVFRAAYP